MISLFADNDTPPRVERCSGNTGFVQQSNQLSLETKCTSKLEVKIKKKKTEEKILLYASLMTNQSLDLRMKFD